MEGRTEPNITAQIAGALDWWRDAGIDCDFTDDPRDWLAKETTPEEALFTPPTTSAKPETPRILIGGPRESWPRDLEAFRAWWLSEPSLDHGQVSRRVPPRGTAGAQVMVLVAEPEDGDSDILLSGREGQLLSAILGALGISAEQAYVASALTRPTPLPDWSQLAAEGLGEVLRHHVGLVAPSRLLVLGNGVSSLLGHDPANKTTNLPLINHEGRTLPLLAAMDLAALLARPRAKAGLWQRLLEWTGTTEP